MSLIKKQTPVLFSRAQQPAGAGTSLPQECRQDPTAEIPACQSTGDTETKAKRISRDLSLGFSSSHLLALCCGTDNGPPPSPPCAGSRDSVGLEAELTLPKIVFV